MWKVPQLSISKDRQVLHSESGTIGLQASMPFSYWQTASDMLPNVRRRGTAAPTELPTQPDSADPAFELPEETHFSGFI